ncbi:MAG TPA: nicotinate-nucleotide--dimethylbenzimidazole phosphoribosyltransferase [Candidatus Binataceae bacterium]|jgi:nicotinate-nucleotide--dimethylbenzimidazole phosphoribosyltransferase|nr:nicotinate-nucleotide--dimethylbenzimidazole phosphoribosyltransferase [Candidatus Binataceae bacterium]
MSVLEETLAAITSPDEIAAAGAGRRLDSLTKPRGSLGYLEEIVRRYTAIRRDPEARIGGGALCVFVADHGVADEGVSAYPQAVTAQMLRNISGGGAAVSVLARRLGYRLWIADVGVAADTSTEALPGVLYRRIGAGTRNLAREPAMSLAEVRAALEVGVEVARDAVASGATLIGIGEMGIANSTSAAALLAAFTGLRPARLAGRGAGVDDAGMRRKVAAIERALKLHRAALKDPLATLAALGGFEIAAMAGACLGGAALNAPVVVDGFIATAAAVAAERLCPGLFAHLFFGHRSSEGGHAIALEQLGVRPIMDLGMRLGEGTGAALAMSVIEAALALFHEMATFESAGVSEKVG